jgi:long-chain acyl-CoA synthetase
MFFRFHELGYWLSTQMKANQPIAILLPNSFACILSLFSIPLSSNYGLPLDATIHPRNLELILANGDIKHIITSKKYSKQLSEVNLDLKIFYIEDIDCFDLSKPCNENILNTFSPIESINPGDTAYIFYTTGTTSTPKGVMLSHNNVLASAQNIAEFMEHKSDIVESIPMPLSHSFGFGRLRSVFYVGGTAIIEPGLLFPNKVLMNIKKYSANAISMVPAGFEVFLETFYEGFLNIANQIQYIEIGSAPMRTERKKQLIEICPNANICMHYGSTEASRTTFINFRKELTHIETIGKASPNTIVEIHDQNGNDISKTGKVGELVAFAKTIAQGYWKNKNLSKQVLKNGSFYTGDLVKADKDGYLHLVGRIKEMINVGGYKVAPTEIEEVMIKFPEIKEVAVVGKINEERKPIEDIFAFIVPKKESTINTQALSEFCKNNLESYKIPKEFKIIDNIPKTKNGKIEKYKLLEF